jgi:transcriptional regulator with XRE-family HTH domain
MGKSLLQQRREEIGFTLRDVESITNGEISNAYLSQLEHGKIKSPSVHIILHLSAAYATPFDVIAEWLGHPPPPPLPTRSECGRPMFPGPARFLIDQEQSA